MTVLGRQVKRESNKNTKEARLSANSILTVVPSFSLSINFTAEDFFIYESIAIESLVCDSLPHPFLIVCYQLLF